LCVSPPGYDRIHEREVRGHERSPAVVDVDHQAVITRAPRERSDGEQRVFRATPSSTRSIRRFVSETLRAARARADVVTDFQLVVSELAANAIEHGTGDDLVVDVDTTQSSWWEVTVSSTLPTGRRRDGRLRTARQWSIADPDASSGRGLGIVRRLMDDVRVEHHADRISVRCRMRR
jgi:anti-sigma regulatory factor (Ser/Thr protein kinase)